MNTTLLRRQLQHLVRSQPSRFTQIRPQVRSRPNFQRALPSSLVCRRSFIALQTEPQKEDANLTLHAEAPHKHLGYPPEGTAPEKKRLRLLVDGDVTTFDHVWLRDVCPCAKCIDPSTTQKTFQTNQIDAMIHPKKMWISQQGLHVLWNRALGGVQETELHHSIYPVELLRKYQSNRNVIRHGNNDRRQVLWDKQRMVENVLWMDYEEYMNSDEKLWEMVKHLSEYGLAFLRNVPRSKTSDPSLKGLAERIGNLKSTFYGDIWNVKFDNNTIKNVAYTAVELGLHMDLLYYESPPAVQFLHCIDNTVSGGASFFADAFYAANQIRSTNEIVFNSLCTFPVTHHYDNGDYHYHFTRPTVTLEPPNESYASKRRRIDSMSWAPPFQAPFELDQNGALVQDSPLFRQYLAAAKYLDSLIQAPQNQYELTLKEGECAIFMNRRVLHARRKFDPSSGKRWLQGAYIDVDAFRSKFRTLMTKFRHQESPAPGGHYSYLKD